MQLDSKMATTKQYILHNLESQIRDSIWNALSKIVGIIIWIGMSNMKELQNKQNLTPTNPKNVCLQ